ncbi:MAG: LapA family protein [Sneathiella sp.]|nr:LapA family protein [Sneathiella sp.]
MKYISWGFIALLCLIVVTLSIGNREAVTFSLFPLPFVMDIPLFILILAGAFLGVLLGSLRTWMADGKARRENRHHKQEVLRLKGEVSRLEKLIAEKDAAISKDADHLLKIADQRDNSAA